MSISLRSDTPARPTAVSSTVAQRAGEKLRCRPALGPDSALAPHIEPVGALLALASALPCSHCAQLLTHTAGVTVLASPPREYLDTGMKRLIDGSRTGVPLGLTESEADRSLTALKNLMLVGAPRLGSRADGRRIWVADPTTPHARRVLAVLRDLDRDTARLVMRVLKKRIASESDRRMLTRALGCPLEALGALLLPQFLRPPRHDAGHHAQPAHGLYPPAGGPLQLMAAWTPRPPSRQGVVYEERASALADACSDNDPVSSRSHMGEPAISKTELAEPTFVTTAKSEKLASPGRASTAGDGAPSTSRTAAASPKRSLRSSVVPPINVENWAAWSEVKPILEELFGEGCVAVAGSDTASPDDASNSPGVVIKAECNSLAWGALRVCYFGFRRKGVKARHPGPDFAPIVLTAWKLWCRVAGRQPSADITPNLHTLAGRILTSRRNSIALESVLPALAGHCVRHVEACKQGKPEWGPNTFAWNDIFKAAEVDRSVTRWGKARRMGETRSTTEYLEQLPPNLPLHEFEIDVSPATESKRRVGKIDWGG